MNIGFSIKDKVKNIFNLIIYFKININLLKNESWTGWAVNNKFIYELHKTDF